MGESWAALYGHARATDGDGYVVDYFPLQKGLDGAPPDLPAEVYEHVTDCHALIDALHDDGALTDEERRDALATLLPQGALVGDRPPIPSPGAALFCRGNIPESLAEAKVLAKLCEGGRFRVYVEADEVDRARMAIADAERARRSIQWLTNLIDRISRGLGDGAYRSMAAPIYDEGQEHPAIETEGFRSLYAVMRFKGQPGDVVWADDRFLTAYSQQDGGVPIVGVSDVLKGLVAAKALSESAYYTKVGMLRAANVRFIPIDADEIIFHLGRAPVDKGTGAVVEREGLGILRRYFAACLAQGSILQRPPVADKVPNKDGETAFILSTKEAIADALARLWEIDDDDDACRSRADWLMRQMYLDLVGLHTLVPIVRAGEQHLSMAAISLARLLSPRLSISAPTAIGAATPRQRYMTWLDERVLRGRLSHQPHLAVAVAENLKGVFLGIFAAEVAEGHDPERVAATIYTTIGSFPAAIRDEVRRDTHFLGRIGFQITDTYPVDDVAFARDDFYRAAARAIEGGEAEIIPVGATTAITLHGGVTPDSRPIVRFADPTTGQDHTITDSAFEFLVADPTAREVALRARRWWFDCDDAAVQHIAAKVSSDEDPASRIVAAMSWWNTSAALYYADLDRRLRGREGVSFGNLLPPDDDGLRRHLRLATDAGSGGTVAAALELAAQALIGEEGLVAAIERLIGLPIPLPAAVVTAIEGLTVGARRALVKDLLRICHTPLARIHLVRILTRFGNDTAAYRRLTTWVVAMLLGREGRAELDAFFALLGWFDREYVRRPDAHDWAPQVRLALVWAHAQRIFSILVATGASAPRLTQALGQPSPYLSDEVLKRARVDWFDIAHPKRAGAAPMSFVLAGLSYALGEQADEFVAHAFKALAVLDAPEADDTPDDAPLAALLVLDPAQAENRLGSFLGMPILDAFPSLRSPDAGNALTQESLHDLVVVAIRVLEQREDDVQAWATLHIILGDLPPYADIADRLRAILRALPLAELVARDEGAGIAALRVACLQAIHGDTAVRDHLRDQLVRIAGRWAADAANLQTADQTEVIRIRGVALFTEAIHLCGTSASTSDIVNSLIDLLTALVEAWADLGPIFRPLVERLYEELPASESSRVVPLLVTLRALA